MCSGGVVRKVRTEMRLIACSDLLCTSFIFVWVELCAISRVQMFVLDRWACESDRTCDACVVYGGSM